ncbi:MAG: hypothetical protein IT426_14805 [Pirellulales bacterium]|nr:hypothetical protein [Pirellulales bacterium]
MSRRGRPPVLTDIKKAEILAVLAAGCSRQTAAAYVGCDLKTIYNTALRDPEFAVQLEKREAVPEVSHLMNLKNASRESRFWRASAWYLERRNPERYAPRPLDLVTNDELERFIRRLTEMLVEEVPVARYRKQIFARLERMFAESPENLERRYRQGKYSYPDRRVFPQNVDPREFDEPENPQNSLAAPEGTNTKSLKTSPQTPPADSPDSGKIP